MTMPAGSRLGPYEVVRLLGAGGMGEVYEARDTRLDRRVAVKVLPPGVGADPERRSRFEREAKAVARLNHPHICVLHDVGHHPPAGPGHPTLYLVMELLDGQTLAERLARGPLPLEEALSAASQIAEALSAAHREGIVHRDLKPGNVMLTKSGAKLLDFGLAKPAALGAAAGARGASLTTMEPLTAEGSLLGTIPYMAPEQLEGRETDARTDVFAFGAVLYEMLTGRRAFAGDTQASLISAIMTSQPPSVSSLQPVTPPALDHLVGRCLAKDPDARWQSAADLAGELRWLAGASRPGSVEGSAPATRSRQRSRWRAPAAALVLLLVAVLGVLAGRQLAPRAPDLPAARLTVWLGDTGLSLLDGGVAVSPDGQTVVFQARAADAVRLYARRLDDFTPRPLAGTEGGSEPFFSPDGEFVAYRSAAGGFDKVALRGGPPQTIWHPPGNRGWTTGASWGADGRIVFGRWPETGLWTVPADGGTPQQVSKTTGEGDWVLWPEVLPGGKTVVFTAWRSGRMFIAAMPIAGGEPRVLADPGAGSRYLPSGHLVYESEGNLFARRFDPVTLEQGERRAVLAEIGRTRFGGSWRQSARGRPYDLSATGTLAYGSGLTRLSRLVWRDRSGTPTPAPLAQRDYNFPTLSPDGRRVADTIYDGPERAQWIGDVSAEPMQRLTRGPDDTFALFNRDGRYLFFTRNDNGRFNLFRVAADGSGNAERVLDTPESKRATSQSPDGRILLLNRRGGEGGMDVCQLKDGVLLTLVPGGRDGRFSPDGRWFSYSSSTGSMKEEIYVREYPDGVAVQVSVDGGVQAIWGPKGDEIFYQNPLRGVMAARVENGRRVGAPTMLFPHASEYRDWDLSPDGSRFLVVEPGEEPKGRSVLNVITNWTRELDRLLPPGR